MDRATDRSTSARAASAAARPAAAAMIWSSRANAAVRRWVAASCSAWAAFAASAAAAARSTASLRERLLLGQGVADLAGVGQPAQLLAQVGAGGLDGQPAGGGQSGRYVGLRPFQRDARLVQLGQQPGGRQQVGDQRRGAARASRHGADAGPAPAPARRGRPRGWRGSRPAAGARPARGHWSARTGSPRPARWRPRPPRPTPRPARRRGRPTAAGAGRTLSSIVGETGQPGQLGDVLVGPGEQLVGPGAHPRDLAAERLGAARPARSRRRRTAPVENSCSSRLRRASASERRKAANSPCGSSTTLVNWSSRMPSRSCSRWPSSSARVVRVSHATGPARAAPPSTSRWSCPRHALRPLPLRGCA